MRKTQYASKSALLILSSFLLLGCGGASEPSETSSSISSFTPGETISVLNANGKFYNAVVESPSADLPIYAAKGKGDVPYVNVADFTNIMITGLGHQGLSYAVEGKKGVIKSSLSPNSKATIDAEKNEIRLANYANLLGAGYLNNNFGRDYCKPNNTQAVRASSKTSAVVAGEEEAVISLKDYNMNVYEQGGNVYAPLELCSVVLNNAALDHDVYNGKDYFHSPQTFKSTPISAYCYSGGGAFSYGWVSGGDTYICNYIPVKAQSGEKYRFAGTDNTGAETEADYCILYEDGSGKFLSKIDGQLQERVIEGFVHRLGYELNGDVLTLYVMNLMPGSDDKASKDNHSSVLKINMGETRYNKAKRSQEAANFAYDLLCLNFDRFYGVKEFRTEGKFDSFLDSKGLKKRLQSTDVSEYVDGLAEFLAKEIGDGHTSLNALPVYIPPRKALLNSLAEKYQSAKVKAITQRQQSLSVKRYEGTGRFYGRDFILVENKTAFCAFDQFASDGYANYFRNYVGMEPEQAIYDTCAFVSNAITEVENYNKNADNKVKIENVVFDLTANGGGSMLTMPFVAGIMVKDPCIRVKDQVAGRIVEYHYECDFDGDGNYGDSYEAKYNFAVMTSSASFSCGTALPSMLKGTSVKLLGEKSAGGAAPVTHFTDGSGAMFQTSGSDIIVYKDASGKYQSVEEGIPVDVEVPESDWYDLKKMDAKVCEVFAK